LPTSATNPLAAPAWCALITMTPGPHNIPTGDRGMLLHAAVVPGGVLLTSPHRTCHGPPRMAEPSDPPEPPEPPEPPQPPLDLATVFEAIRPQLLRMAERMCASRADAEDVVQDTFLRVMHIGIPAEVRNVDAWITTIFQRRFLDQLRKKARQPSHEAMQEDQHGVTQLAPDGPEPRWNQIATDDIRAAADSLEPVYREVYLLHTFEDLSYQEIVDRQGVERVTVGTRLHRARKKLREILIVRFGLEDER
jgi:RNA polymerase sigma-70 factor, ECF subfamily